MTKKVAMDTGTAGELAEAAAKDPAFLETIVEAISGDNRKVRQRCAGAVEMISEINPELLLPYVRDIIDALYRPEARTRWEALETLCNIVPIDARSCERGVNGAETSLFDEESGPARLAAFKFLSVYGATTANRAARVWPMLDEAIQCYHGDAEFNDMLNALIIYAQGKATRAVKDELIERMRFDAENSRGTLGRKSKEIVELAGN